MRGKYRLLFGLLAALLAAFALVLGIGHALTRAPGDRTQLAPPRQLAHEFTLHDGEGRRIAATARPGRPGAGSVLLLHQRHASRQAMQGRADLLQQQGMAVLLIDLPGHGDSDGDRRGYGRLEVPAVQAAWDWMQREWPAERKAVIGVSLGAAAWVFADARPKPVAVVLEMMYGQLDEAIANRLRLRLGEPGTWLAPLLSWTLPLWVGAGLDAHRPIDRLPSLGAPLLMLAGTADAHTTAAQSQRLFAAAVEPKALWMIEGAAHTDFLAFDPAGYQARVLPFLRSHLQPESS